MNSPSGGIIGLQMTRIEPKSPSGRLRASGYPISSLCGTEARAHLFSNGVLVEFMSHVSEWRNDPPINFIDFNWTVGVLWLLLIV